MQVDFTHSLTNLPVADTTLDIAAAAKARRLPTSAAPDMESLLKSFGDDNKAAAATSASFAPEVKAVPPAAAAEAPAPKEAVSQSVEDDYASKRISLDVWGKLPNQQLPEQQQQQQGDPSPEVMQVLVFRVFHCKELKAAGGWRFYIFLLLTSQHFLSTLVLCKTWLQQNNVCTLYSVLLNKAHCRNAHLHCMY